MTKKEQFDIDSQHFNLIIESLLFTADAAFEINTTENDTGKFLEVIESLLEDNPILSKSLQLKNINIFDDNFEEDSAFVSNIKQIFSDKLIIKQL